MPELPEVETVARGLAARALGCRVTDVHIERADVIRGRADEFAENLRGRWLVGVSRKGKVLALELARAGEPHAFLVVRLGMTGRLTVQQASDPLEPHTHVRITLDGGPREIRFRDPRRFGSLRRLTRAELESLHSKLGHDARHVTEDEFFAATRNRRGALKSWLMNQGAVAGLGNIYADESLFAARLHPLAQPGRLTREAARKLYRAVRQVLDRAIRLQGTSFRDYVNIEGQPGGYAQRLNVYGREGLPCRRCRTPIRRIVIAGRSSHFCARCQPRRK